MRLEIVIPTNDLVNNFSNSLEKAMTTGQQIDLTRLRYLESI